MILQYNEIEEHKDNNLIKGKPDDFGYDVRAGEDGIISPGCSSDFIYTGLHVHMPPWIGATMKTRSGHMKLNLVVDGTIDPGYHGAIGIKIHNLDNLNEFRFKKGDRIAQIVFHVRPEGLINNLFDTRSIFGIAETMNMTDWPETDRGSKGFGHTGVD